MEGCLVHDRMFCSITFFQPPMPVAPPSCGNSACHQMLLNVLREGNSCSWLRTTNLKLGIVLYLCTIKVIKCLEHYCFGTLKREKERNFLYSLGIAIDFTCPLKQKSCKIHVNVLAKVSNNKNRLVSKSFFIQCDREHRDLIMVLSLASP